MDEEAEIELIERVAAREQRRFRMLIFFAAIFMMVLTGVTAWQGVSTAQNLGELRKLAETNAATAKKLSEDAHDSRQEISDAEVSQTNLANEQRQSYREVTELLATQTAQGISPDALTEVLAATRDYLTFGKRLGLTNALLIDAALRSPEAATLMTPSENALLKGVQQLNQFEVSGQRLQQNKETRVAELAEPLKEAQQSFEDAVRLARQQLPGNPGDRSKAAALPTAGLARIAYLDASANDFSEARCGLDGVIGIVKRNDTRRQFYPLPMVWRAQCLRKMGLAENAAAAYGDAAQALSTKEPYASTLKIQETGAMTTAVLAFNGLGASLVSTADISASSELNAKALEHARKLCREGASEPNFSADAEPMELAKRCLDQAIYYRRLLKQSEAEVGYTGENIGFTFLRRGDYRGALKNADQYKSTPLAWNSVVRWLALKHLGNDENAKVEDPAIGKAYNDALLFHRTEFNECELLQLVGPKFRKAVLDLLGKTRDADKAVNCPAPTGALGAL